MGTARKMIYSLDGWAPLDGVYRFTNRARRAVARGRTPRLSRSYGGTVVEQAGEMRRVGTPRRDKIKEATTFICPEASCGAWNTVDPSKLLA